MTSVEKPKTPNNSSGTVVWEMCWKMYAHMQTDAARLAGTKLFSASDDDFNKSYKPYDPNRSYFLNLR